MNQRIEINKNFYIQWNNTRQIDREITRDSVRDIRIMITTPEQKKRKK